VTHNLVDGAGEVGVSFLETASGHITFNDINRRDIGVQIGGSAAPSIVGNRVHGSRLVGLLFAEDASGSATLNRVDQLVGSSIEVGGTSHPDLVDNEVGGSQFGIVYVDDATGSARNNRFHGHDVGVQVQDAAGPSLTANRFDGIAMAAIVFSGTFVGAATGNDCGTGEGGIIAVVDTAEPTLADNVCEVVQAE
jgi:nitrous oxidase accessory protein NosD